MRNGLPAEALEKTQSEGKCEYCREPVRNSRSRVHGEFTMREGKFFRNCEGFFMPSGWDWGFAFALGAESPTKSLHAT